MYNEKHYLNKIYNNHRLYRATDIVVYELTPINCSATELTGYSGTESTLVDMPMWNQKFSSYSITGADLTGNNFTFTADVTAQANYETAKMIATTGCTVNPTSGFLYDHFTATPTPTWKQKFSGYSASGATYTGNNFTITGDSVAVQANYELAKRVTYGTRTSGSKVSGFIGEQVTITGVPAWNERTSSYSIAGAVLTGNVFEFIGNNVTVKANFETAKNVTTDRCAASPVSGFTGTTVTLTADSPEWNEKFSAFTVTGATLTGSQFTLTGSNVTAKANYETAKTITYGARTSGNKVSGFIGDQVTVTATPNWNEKTSSYSITGATLTGNKFNITNNNVTVAANFETAKNITYGTRTSGSKVSGFIGDQVTITGTPNWNERTSSYSVTGATLTGNTFTLTGANVTAKANFETAKNVQTTGCTVNPTSGFTGTIVTATPTPEWNQKLSGYRTTGCTVTGSTFTITGSAAKISAGFETAKNVTVLTADYGTIAADVMSGFSGDIVTLSNTPNSGFELSAYSITGATLTGNQFKFAQSDVTAGATFTMTSFVPLGSTGAYYDDDAEITNRYTSGICVNGPNGHVANLSMPATAKYAAYQYEMSANDNMTGYADKFGFSLANTATGGKLPSYTTYIVWAPVTTSTAIGPARISIIVDITANTLTGYLNREQVMTANNVPKPMFVNTVQQFKSYVAYNILSGITYRLFNTLTDATNFVNLWS